MVQRLQRPAALELCSVWLLHEPLSGQRARSRLRQSPRPPCPAVLRRGRRGQQQHGRVQAPAVPGGWQGMLLGGGQGWEVMRGRGSMSRFDVVAVGPVGFMLFMPEEPAGGAQPLELLLAGASSNPSIQPHSWSHLPPVVPNPHPRSFSQNPHPVSTRMLSNAQRRLSACCPWLGRCGSATTAAAPARPAHAALR